MGCRSRSSPARASAARSRRSRTRRTTRTGEVRALVGVNRNGSSINDDLSHVPRLPPGAGEQRVLAGIRSGPPTRKILGRGMRRRCNVCCAQSRMILRPMLPPSSGLVARVDDVGVHTVRRASTQVAVCEVLAHRGWQCWWRRRRRVRQPHASKTLKNPLSARPTLTTCSAMLSAGVARWRALRRLASSREKKRAADARGGWTSLTSSRWARAVQAVIRRRERVTRLLCRSTSTA